MLEIQQCIAKYFGDPSQDHADRIVTVLNGFVEKTQCTVETEFRRIRTRLVVATLISECLHCIGAPTALQLLLMHNALDETLKTALLSATAEAALPMPVLIAAASLNTNELETWKTDRQKHAAVLLSLTTASPPDADAQLRHELDVALVDSRGCLERNSAYQLLNYVRTAALTHNQLWLLCACFETAKLGNYVETVELEMALLANSFEIKRVLKPATLELMRICAQPSGAQLMDDFLQGEAFGVTDVLELYLCSMSSLEMIGDWTGVERLLITEEVVDICVRGGRAVRSFAILGLLSLCHFYAKALVPSEHFAQWMRLLMRMWRSEIAVHFARLLVESTSLLTSRAHLLVHVVQNIQDQRLRKILCQETVLRGLPDEEVRAIRSSADK